MVSAHFHFGADVEQILKQLHWLVRNPDLPTNSKDRIVRKLVYGDDETEIGLIAQYQDTDTYWTIVTNPMIICPSPATLLERKTLADAMDDLKYYAAMELKRVSLLKFGSQRMKIRYKTRDRAAAKQYMSDGANFTEGFKCGINWMVHSEQFPRRPSWAQFLVQNRDKTFTWFEEEPVPNHNTGRWESDGRSKEVELQHENWIGRIKRLD